MPNRNKRTYRLGLDVGSNSLGWFVVWLNEKGEAVSLGPGGVRIYPDGRDPQSKTSNAVDRRVARGARRRRDRYLRRRSTLMALLVRHDLMPTDELERKALEKLDPYELRAKALDETLPPHHVGRAIFHLDQRRGFLSNRKTEKGDKESGAIKEGARRLEKAMADEHARSLGEVLYRRHRDRAPVRARNRSAGAKTEYEFYPTRQMAIDEFEAVWNRQSPHHTQMSPQARDEIHRTIFFQRPLKQPPVGKCSLDPANDPADLEGFRCPWAHPLAQRFRILQEIRNLQIAEAGKRPVPLTKEQGNAVALALYQTNKFSFDKIRALLKLPAEAKFNLESAKRQDLLGDETAAKLSHKSLFGKAWRSFPTDRQIAIVTRLLESEDEAKLIEWLISDTGLDAKTAERVATAFLPDGHCRLGLRAIRKIVPFMDKGGMIYPDAAKAAGYDHAQRPTGEQSLSGYLPYYGEWVQDDVLGSGDERDTSDKRWGRFPNPTVHIGLGQIRRVVNALIHQYGPPTEVAVEMTRGFKLSPRQLSELDAEQAENQRNNERRRKIILEHGQADTGRNILKLRLWEDLNQDGLDRICPYTGERISITRLLSEEVDIDHLIPFSESWDDSPANKTVCMAYANRAKGKRTPFEAFGSSPPGFDWAQISERAAALPKNKRWRFGPDAYERFDALGGFQARQLNETGWLARVAKQYLGAVANPYKIHVLPGKLTAMIRGKWRLNTLLPDHNYSDAKNRKDHRHHAIDAMVAALTDRSLLHRMSSAYDEERQRIEIPLPWPALREDLDGKLKAMTISHKADHGVQAQLHEDTAYGSINEPEKEGGNLVYRKPFRGLNEQEIGRIRDRRLRDLVKNHIDAERLAGRDLKTALQSFADRTDIPGYPGPIRHVRLIKTEKPEYLVPVRDRTGEVYKSYSAGENAFVEIFETTDGKWRGEATSIFAANRSDLATEWHHRFPGAALIMRVFKGDLIVVDDGGKRTAMVVHRLDAANSRFKLAPHHETGNLDQRHADPSDPFRWLMASYSTLRTLNAERVRVDELGRLWRVHRRITPQAAE